MDNFTTSNYSLKQVRRAGDSLRGDVPWTNKDREKSLEIFKIANQWRESHKYPMRKIRYGITGKMRKYSIDGISAARLKRMQSIRKKLSTIPENLNQLQDLGGCRAILTSNSDAQKMVEILKRELPHELIREDNYIIDPKLDGYRSHHLIFKFNAEEDKREYEGRRIEVQIRSRLQHTWATAVEAVGLMRGEDLKGGSGNREWLRLFELMSAELAHAEGFYNSTTTPPQELRIKEIQELNNKLKAIETLENLRWAVRFSDTHFRDPNYKAKYYLITFNHKTQTVTIELYNKVFKGTKSLIDNEISDAENDRFHINRVLVEADKVDNLKKAYPNYFGDVKLFTANLTNITLGRDAEEFTMPPQKSLPPPPNEPGDMSWFRGSIKWNRHENLKFRK